MFKVSSPCAFLGSLAMTTMSTITLSVVVPPMEPRRVQLIDKTLLLNAKSDLRVNRPFGLFAFLSPGKNVSDICVDIARNFAQ